MLIIGALRLSLAILALPVFTLGFWGSKTRGAEIAALFSDEILEVLG